MKTLFLKLAIAAGLVISTASVSAQAQEVELDEILLREAFDAADSTGDGTIDEADSAADVIAAFVVVVDQVLLAGSLIREAPDEKDP